MVHQSPILGGVSEIYFRLVYHNLIDIPNKFILSYEIDELKNRLDLKVF
jgi:hypothetical protein